jgi:two-component system, LytTR family, response regulator LytT
MNLLIIEDEEPIVRHLRSQLNQIDSSLLVETVSSVAEAVRFMRSSTALDLILSDIYLSDGLAFEIFDQVACSTPVIFCTAYDQYAIKAFEVNSVDYLLKPVRQDDLRKAFLKYHNLFSNRHTSSAIQESIKRLATQLLAPNFYRRSFLLPNKTKLIPIGTDEISYFISENGITRCNTRNGQLYPMAESLETLAEELDPSDFFRANRQYLIHRKAILDVQYYFNGRLVVNTLPKTDKSLIISKEKASEFKQWMQG